MTQIDQLKHFMARRKLETLAAMYGTTRNTILVGIREAVRPSSITPDDWEDIISYREEWHKANNELRGRNESPNSQ